jgi:hypothetical protein
VSTATKKKANMIDKGAKRMTMKMMRMRMRMMEMAMKMKRKKRMKKKMKPMMEIVRRHHTYRHRNQRELKKAEMMEMVATLMMM